MFIVASYQRDKLKYFCVSELHDGKGCLFEQLYAPFCLYLKLIGRFRSELDGYRAFLLAHYVFKKSVSVSDKTSGIIYKSEYWIGLSGELHHYLFVYNAIFI